LISIAELFDFKPPRVEVFYILQKNTELVQKPQRGVVISPGIAKHSEV